MTDTIAEPRGDIDIAALVLPDRIHGRLYRDPAIFRLEIEKLWSKVWIYIGHESEVAAPGDYVRREVGPQPVIMVRGADGRVRVFFNRCRHRANLLCHKAQGHVAEFVCPYHGWCFSTSGEL